MLLTGRVGDDFESLWDPTSILALVDVCVEKSLNQGRFSKPRLADNHHGELEAFFERFTVTLVWEIVETNEAGETLFRDRSRLERVRRCTARHGSG